MIALRASVIALSLFAFALPARGAEPAVKLVSAKPGEAPAVEITGRSVSAKADAPLVTRP